jgi:hypothetical protein
MLYAPHALSAAVPVRMEADGKPSSASAARVAQPPDGVASLPDWESRVFRARSTLRDPTVRSGYVTGIVIAHPLMLTHNPGC